MAWNGILTSIPGLVAGADLRTHQYKFMDLDATGKVILAAVLGTGTIGVLQNKPNVGQAVELCTIGVTPVIAGAAIAAGAEVMTGATGTALTGATVGSHIAGRALEAAAGAASKFTAFVNCGPGIF